MSKHKGDKYEREFQGHCDDVGLPAERIKGSGAFPSSDSADLKVCDEVLVEVKFRRTGEGFASLYDLSTNKGEGVRVEGNGVTLWVRTMDQWGRMMRNRMDGISPDSLDVTVVETGRKYTQLCGWVKGCQYIAVRMPRREWLVVEVLER